MTETVREHVDSHLDETIEGLKRLTRQPSISAQRLGVIECGEMVVEMLRDAGFDAGLVPTADPGYPGIIAELKGASDRSLLFYNHYDVQPPDPLDEWETPPFEPTERDGYLYGRGISDDKGPIAARLAAIRAVRDTMGELPITIRWCLEGAEEIGSPGFHDFVEQNAERIRSDVCIWEGGGVNWDGRPMVMLGVKGLLYVELECRSAKTDSHSSYAPVVPNPAWRLVWALNTLKDESERIAIPGFYDRIRPALENETKAIAALPDTSREFLHDLGVEMAVGEASGYEFRRRLIMEPTANIAGFGAGYTGQGAKTILPAVARAKLDFRLVPNQGPAGDPAEPPRAPGPERVQRRHHLQPHVGAPGAHVDRGPVRAAGGGLGAARLRERAVHRAQHDRHRAATPRPAHPRRARGLVRHRLPRQPHPRAQREHPAGLLPPRRAPHRRAHHGTRRVAMEWRTPNSR